MLTVSRLMGIGSSCPSTWARTRCSYGRHAVNCERYLNTFSALVWKMCGPYWWMRIPASSYVSYALPPMWGRRSTIRTRRPASRASRSASTLPAKPAPTTRKSNIHDLHIFSQDLVYQRVHLGPRTVPGECLEEAVSACAAKCRLFGEQRFDCRDERIRIVGDGHQAVLGVRVHHVADRC